MPSLYDIFSNFHDMVVPRAVQQETHMADTLRQTDPQAYQQYMKTPPQLSNIAGTLGGLMPVAGMAKTFKAGPSTVEAYVNHLVNTGETMPNRGSSLLPSIRLPRFGEIFSGAPGGMHPTSLAEEAITQRGLPVSMKQLEYGYVPAYEGAPFIHETLAGRLRMPGGPETVKKVLDRGLSIDDVIAMLKEHGVALPR